jgi:hypothetical protein
LNKDVSEGRQKQGHLIQISNVYGSVKIESTKSASDKTAGITLILRKKENEQEDTRKI